jgi:hypothetical protein
MVERCSRMADKIIKGLSSKAKMAEFTVANEKMTEFSKMAEH